MRPSLCVSVVAFVSVFVSVFALVFVFVSLFVLVGVRQKGNETQSVSVCVFSVCLYLSRFCLRLFLSLSAFASFLHVLAL